MAAPTRFTEPQRTSPTAKIPATLVSIGSGSRPVDAHVGAGSDEPLLVERDAAADQPGRRRIGAGEDEEVRDGVLLLGPVRR